MFDTIIAYYCTKYLTKDILRLLRSQKQTKFILKKFRPGHNYISISWMGKNIFLTPENHWIHNYIQDWTWKWYPALMISTV